MKYIYDALYYVRNIVFCLTLVSVGYMSLQYAPIAIVLDNVDVSIGNTEHISGNYSIFIDGELPKQKNFKALYAVARNITGIPKETKNGYVFPSTQENESRRYTISHNLTVTSPISLYPLSATQIMVYAKHATPIIEGMSTPLPLTEVGWLTSRQPIGLLSFASGSMFLGRDENGLQYGDLLRGVVSVPQVEKRQLADDIFHETNIASRLHDCSNSMSGEPSMQIALSKDVPTTQQESRRTSLLLSSKNHDACSYFKETLQIVPGRVYVLQFDYKNLEGNIAQAVYSFSNEQSAQQDTLQIFPGVITEYTNDTEWHTATKIIDPTKLKPAHEDNLANIFNTDTLTVHLYATSDGLSSVTNLYTNIRLLAYDASQGEQLTFDKEKKFVATSQPFALIKKLNNVSFAETNKNLLEPFNASFDEGAWQENADDCSKSLPGEPQFDLSLLQDDSQAKGGRALKISSSNHFACVTKTFPVDLYKTKRYKFTFDYKTIEGSTMQFFYVLHGDVNQITKFDNVKQRGEGWNTYEYTINLTEDAKGLTLYLYAPSDGSKKITTLYDNITLTELGPIDTNTYLITSKATNTTQTSSHIQNIDSFISLQSKLVITTAKSYVVIVLDALAPSRWSLYRYRTPFSGLLINPVPESLSFEGSGKTVAWVLPIREICESTLCVYNADGTITVTLGLQHKSVYLLSAPVVVLLAYVINSMYISINNKS